MFKRKGKRKRNRWRQWSTDRPSCIDSPLWSFLCRRKSGLVCRSPPFASCGDRPRRPGPTVVRCWALLPVRTHTANTKTCAPNTAVTKTTTTVNSFRPAEVLLRSPERRRWISVPVLLCYPAVLFPEEDGRIPYHSIHKPSRDRYISESDFEVPALIRYSAFRFTECRWSHGLVPNSTRMQTRVIQLVERWKKRLKFESIKMYFNIESNLK